MSQPHRPPSAGYQRTFPGLVAAMIVVVLVVVGWSLFRALTSDKEATPVPTVDWKPVVQAAADAGSVPVLAPTRLPEGWRATSAEVRPDGLHLGMLTDEGKYVGVEESAGSLDALVEQYVDENAEPGADVQIDGTTWRSWTDAGGDYAVGRIVLAEGTGAKSSYLVVGSAPASQVRDFAASLQPVGR